MHINSQATLVTRLIVFYALLVLAGTSYSNESKSFWDDRERGWFWYEDPIVEEEEELETQDSIVIPVQPSMTAVEQLRKDGEHYEELAAKAQLDPTPENIREYIEYTRYITARTRRFSSAFKDEILFNPHYDTKPKNKSAPVVTIAGNEEMEALTKKIQSKSKQYSVLFFLRSDCRYCRKFSPILKMVAQETGLYVLPISLDGAGLPEFPNARYSPQLVNRAGVKEVPAVFLLNPKKDIIQPVSMGFKGYSEFRNRLGKALDYIDRTVLGVTKNEY